MGRGIGRSQRRIGIGVATSYAGGGVSYEPEITTYIDGLTTPLSSGQLTKLNTLVSDLKTGLSINSLSDAFDVLYVLGNETAEAALRNLVKRSHDADAVNSPTFTALEGFTGDGSTSYIDTNYNPNTEGVNLLQDDVGIIVYQRTNSLITSYSFGALDGSLNGLMLAPVLTASDVTGCRINDGGGLNAPSSSDNKGIWTIQRTGANAREIFKNNLSLLSDTEVSTAIPSLNQYILGRNDAGSADSHLEAQISFYITGKSLSASGRTVVQDAIEKYMDSNGTGIIP